MAGERSIVAFDPQEISGRSRKRVPSHRIITHNLTVDWQTRIRGAGGTIAGWFRNANNNVRRENLLTFEPVPQEVMERHNHYEPPTLAERARGEFKVSLPLPRIP